MDGDPRHLLYPCQDLFGPLVGSSVSQEVDSLCAPHCSGTAEDIQSIGAPSSTQGLHPLSQCCKVLRRRGHKIVSPGLHSRAELDYSERLFLTDLLLRWRNCFMRPSILNTHDLIYHKPQTHKSVSHSTCLHELEELVFDQIQPLTHGGGGVNYQHNLGKEEKEERSEGKCV